MRNAFKNTTYFISEAKTIFKVDLLSNILSSLSIGLIFFILSLIIAGWLVGNDIVQVVERETEISIYYNENLDDKSLDDLLNNIQNIKGINKASIVNKEESYNRMVDILGQEASILGYFEENPFSPFIEVKIEMDGLDDILSRLETLDDIEYIRDNRQVIEKLQGIISILEIIGLFLVAAVGVSTIIIVSHIIRQGIYNNRDEINTLKLLGAPDNFIQFPFFLEGIILTMIGGGVASILWVVLMQYGFSNINNILPFLPLPSVDEIGMSMIVFIMTFSLFIGLIGSKFGLKSIRKQYS
ncbi:MAG: permease-like cell division protein FtsX [Tissierellaceae bacterium]|nr:permease-like cell division protein FtsX [Tissierellaceae bacterium]